MFLLGGGTGSRCLYDETSEEEEASGAIAWYVLLSDLVSVFTCYGRMAPPDSLLQLRSWSYQRLCWSRQCLNLASFQRRANSKFLRSGALFFFSFSDIDIDLSLFERASLLICHRDLSGIPEPEVLTKYDVVILAANLLQQAKLTWEEEEPDYTLCTWCVVYL